MVPLVAVAQVTCVNVDVEVILAPVDRKTVLVPVQPTASLILMMWLPPVSPVNALLDPHGPPSI